MVNKKKIHYSSEDGTEKSFPEAWSHPHTQDKFLYSCIKTYAHSCLKPLSNERTSMFKSWDSRAVWTWVLIQQYFKWAPICLSDVTRKALQPGLIITRIMTLWRRYDVRKFNADAILFGENQC